MAQKTNADLLALWEGLTDAPTAEDTDATLDTVVQQLNADFEAQSRPCIPVPIHYCLGRRICSIAGFLQNEVL